MHFDLTVSLPREARHAATARLIAAASAREAGSADAPAEAFATRVEDAARTRLTTPDTDQHVHMAVYRDAGALVVTIDHQTVRLDL
jgi:hypothetical protein